MTGKVSSMMTVALLHSEGGIGGLNSEEEEEEEEGKGKVVLSDLACN